MIGLHDQERGTRTLNTTGSIGFAVAAILMTIPSGLLGLIFGPPSLVVVLTREIDSGEMWLSALSYLAMLVGAVVVIIGVMKRNPRQTSIGLVVVAAGWAGAAWDRHRDQFTEWLLVVAVISLLLAVLIRVTNRSPGDSDGNVVPDTLE